MPTVVLTTTNFESLTRTVAATLGLPSARILVVPHPLGGTDPTVVAGWADTVADQALGLLVEG